MLGRPFHPMMDDVETSKKDGSILQKAIKLVEKEDKETHDSDLEVETVASLLRNTIQLNPKLRSLEHCMNIIARYEIENDLSPSNSARKSCQGSPKVPGLNVVEKVGYF
jgi:hypothetical protein